MFKSPGFSRPLDLIHFSANLEPSMIPPELWLAVATDFRKSFHGRGQGAPRLCSPEAFCRMHRVVGLELRAVENFFLVFFS